MLKFKQGIDTQKTELHLVEYYIQRKHGPFVVNHVSEEELIKVARESLLRTGADYIVANDLASIKAGNHKAFIVDKDTTESVEGKIAIAKEITNLVKESDYE